MIKLDDRLEIEMVPLPSELEKIETSLAARQITGSEAGELIYREKNTGRQEQQRENEPTQLEPN